MSDHDLTPDELEQRQNPDGSYDEDADEEVDRPLTADEIEQRQVVEYDDDDAPVPDDE